MVWGSEKKTGFFRHVCNRPWCVENVITLKKNTYSVLCCVMVSFDCNAMERLNPLQTFLVVTILGRYPRTNNILGRYRQNRPTNTKKISLVFKISYFVCSLGFILKLNEYGEKQTPDKTVSHKKLPSFERSGTLCITT